MLISIDTDISCLFCCRCSTYMPCALPVNVPLMCRIVFAETFPSRSRLSVRACSTLKWTYRSISLALLEAFMYRLGSSCSCRVMSLSSLLDTNIFVDEPCCIMLLKAASKLCRVVTLHSSTASIIMVVHVYCSVNLTMRSTHSSSRKGPSAKCLHCRSVYFAATNLESRAWGPDIDSCLTILRRMPSGIARSRSVSFRLQ